MNKPSKFAEAQKEQAEQPAATQDLSEFIDVSVEKEVGEEVRTVWLFGDNYRCNWWMREPYAGPAYLNLGKIIRSKFLKATMVDQKLVIEDLSRRA